MLDRPEHCTLSRVVALATVCVVVVVCTYATSSPAGDVGKEQKYNIWRRRSPPASLISSVQIIHCFSGLLLLQPNQT